jgi:hypothetical protein
MRSVGAAGWAQRGYFGLHAQTFGNPDGADQGGGAWTGVTNQGGDGGAGGLGALGLRDGGDNPNGPHQGGGGGGPPPAPVFVLRATLPSATRGVIGLATNSLGVTLALGRTATNHVDVYRSTDGGHTWTGPVGTFLPGFAANLGNLVVAGGAGGTWMVGDQANAGTGPNQVWRSTDTGATWTAIANTTDLGSTNTLITDGLGNWLVQNGTNVPAATSHATSTDNGLTWAIGTQPLSGSEFLNQQNMVYGGPGVGYVVGGFDSTVPQSLTWQSTDGGHTWAKTVNINGALMSNLLDVGATLFGTDVNIAAGYAASSAPLLGVAAALPLPFTAVYLLKAASGFFIFDGGFGFAESPNFTAWSTGPLNLTGFNTSVCYDAVNASVIAGGSDGSIATSP